MCPTRVKAQDQSRGRRKLLAHSRDDLVDRMGMVLQAKLVEVHLIFLVLELQSREKMRLSTLPKRWKSGAFLDEHRKVNNDFMGFKWI